jgi:hypothetical protein
LCCLTFLRQYTFIVFGKWDTSSVLSQKADPTKNVFDTQDLWPYWRKNHVCFAFVNPNPIQWIFWPTNEILIQGIRLKIKTINVLSLFQHCSNKFGKIQQSSTLPHIQHTRFNVPISLLETKFSSSTCISGPWVFLHFFSSKI